MRSHVPPHPIHVELTDDAIDVSGYLDHVADDDVGAHVWFHGVTRRRTTTSDGRVMTTVALSYEAHHAMAVALMRQICEQAIKRFGLTSMVVVHRLGDVPVRQASVLVGCSSPHRKSGFEAVSWFMDRLKTDVPIWKRELFEDGTKQWQHPDPPLGKSEASRE